MKKTNIFIIGGLVIAIAAVLFIGSGFRKCANVVLDDFSVSEDGSTLSMNVDITGSVGHVRDIRVKQKGDNKYLTFYSCFGGLNSNIGAKDKFDISLNPSDTSIYVYDGGGEYRKIKIQDDKPGEA